MKNGSISHWLITLGMLCAVGCQQSDLLRGKVTYNGQPVELGSVTFASKDGSGPGFGAQVADGEYRTDKVRLGQHVAHVRGLTESSVLSKEQSIELREQRDHRHGLPVDYIPEDAKGNAQTFDIMGGAQTIDFDITGPPRPD